MSDIKIKGSGRCPRCASRRVIQKPAPETAFYGKEFEICVNCKAFWEPFDPAQLLDIDQPTISSFREPCDNCAFRPGSVEQSDPKLWAEIMAQLKISGTFNCHKGVPIDLHSENGFAYPTTQKKLRMCRGWLRMSLTRLEKEWRETLSQAEASR